MNKIIYCGYTKDIVKEKEILRALKNNTVSNLEIVSSNDSQFISDIFIFLASNSSLRKLNICRTKIGSNITKLCTALNQNSSINYLDIRLNDIDNDGICALADLLFKNKTITSLYIEEIDLSKKNMVALFYSLCCNTNLKKLKISCDTLNHNNFKSLITMLHSNQTLRCLELNMSFLDIDLAHTFADELQTNITLEKLSLGCNYLDQTFDSFVTNELLSIILDALTYNSNLKCLEIFTSNIGETEALMISDFLKVNNSLESLILYDTKIEINGLISLCNQSSLKYLDVECYHIERISNDNINELFKVLSENTTLTRLGIHLAEINNGFLDKMVMNITENYTIIDFVGLDLEETSCAVYDFLNRNRSAVNESRFKKVKPLTSI